MNRGWMECGEESPEGDWSAAHICHNERCGVGEWLKLNEI